MLMALASYLSPGMACAAMPDTSFLDGMATMYLLMGVFHLAPWLRLGSVGTASDEEGRAGRT